MNEQWEELKETIVELRDNDGTGTQQEVCKFLVNYMDILEKQMQEPSGDVVSRQAVLDCLTATKLKKFDFILRAREEIKKLPPVTPQPKTGHWIRWYEQKEIERYTDYIPHCKCSECGKEYDPYSSQFIKYCNECGAKMEDIEE